MTSIPAIEAVVERLLEAERVLFITGAGISADSGLPTYRGIGGLYKNAERLARYDFSDPIHVENIAVHYRRAKPVDFRMVADLYGKRVGVLRGWSYGGTFDAASQSGWIATEEVSSDRSNFLKLMDGRLDAVLAIAESGTRAAISTTRRTSPLIRPTKPGESGIGVWAGRTVLGVTMFSLMNAGR